MMTDADGHANRWTPTLGPDFKGVPFDTSTNGARISLLTDDERRELAQIASVVYVKPGSPLYTEGAPIEAAYNIISGVVKTSRKLPGGKRIVTGFMFPSDLIANSSEGHYVDTAVAVNAVSAYRMEKAPLLSLVLRNPALQFRFMHYVGFRVREAEQHSIVLSRTKTATAKLASFLDMIRQRQANDGQGDEIHLAMRRNEIASYLALSVESISRAFRVLETQGVIAIRDQRYVRICDQSRFDRLLPIGRPAAVAHE